MRALLLASAIVALADAFPPEPTRARHAAADALARSLAPPTSTNRRTSEPAAAASCEANRARSRARHPHLIAARERVRAALARSDAAGALPPPTVGLEVWSFPIGDPSQADHRGTYIARVGEVLPPGGALDGRARAEAEDARAQVATIAEHAADVRAEVLDACVQWSAAEDVRVHLVAYRDLIVELHDALVARTSPDIVSDVVRADAEVAMAERRGWKPRRSAMRGGSCSARSSRGALRCRRRRHHCPRRAVCRTQRRYFTQRSRRAASSPRRMREWSRLGRKRARHRPRRTSRRSRWARATCRTRLRLSGSALWSR